MPVRTPRRTRLLQGRAAEEGRAAGNLAVEAADTAGYGGSGSAKSSTRVRISGYSGRQAPVPVARWLGSSGSTPSGSGVSSGSTPAHAGAPPPGQRASTGRPARLADPLRQRLRLLVPGSGRQRPARRDSRRSKAMPARRRRWRSSWPCGAGAGRGSPVSVRGAIHRGRGSLQTHVVDDRRQRLIRFQLAVVLAVVVIVIVIVIGIYSSARVGSYLAGPAGGERS